MLSSLSARRAWIEIDVEGKIDADLWSLSARRAWIEILSLLICAFWTASLSARRAWIEMHMAAALLAKLRSLSARRAWIEIIHPRRKSDDKYVALRKESVDRNIDTQDFCICVIVALRKESVDRN